MPSPGTLERHLTGLPSDWSATTVGELGNVIGGSTPSRAAARYWNGHIPWVTPGELTALTTKYLEDTREHITQAGLDSCGARLLPEGTLLVTSRATIGSVALVRQPTATNQGFKSIVFARGAEPSFYYHLFQRIVSELERRASGTTFLEISGREFGAVRLPVPPLAEQRRIAEILDTLDEAIRKTEQLSAKLRQMKQGLLHDLLTRGINDNGKLRNPDRHPEQFTSSADGLWPATWDRVALGEACDLQVGYAFKSEWFSDYEGSRLLRGENVGYGVPDWSDTKRLPEVHSRGFSEYLLHAGDVVIGMDRTFTKSGVKISVVGSDDLPALLVQRVGRFVPRGAMHGFLLQLLRWPAFHRELLAQQKGMDIPHLSKTEILSPLMPLPPDDEQNQIAQVLADADARIEAEIWSAKKLSAAKTGLLEDLLTGRVRTVDTHAQGTRSA